MQRSSALDSSLAKKSVSVASWKERKSRGDTEAGDKSQPKQKRPRKFGVFDQPESIAAIPALPKFEEEVRVHNEPTITALRGI